LRCRSKWKQNMTVERYAAKAAKFTAVVTC
jgi:hypothetical protein